MASSKADNSVEDKKLEAKSEMKSSQNLPIRIDLYRDHSKTIFVKSKIGERTSEEEVATGTATVTLM